MIFLIINLTYIYMVVYYVISVQEKRVEGKKIYYDTLFRRELSSSLINVIPIDKIKDTLHLLFSDVTHCVIIEEFFVKEKSNSNE